MNFTKRSRGGRNSRFDSLNTGDDESKKMFSSKRAMQRRREKEKKNSARNDPGLYLKKRPVKKEKKQDIEIDDVELFPTLGGGEETSSPVVIKSEKKDISDSPKVKYNNVVDNTEVPEKPVENYNPYLDPNNVPPGWLLYYRDENNVIQKKEGPKPDWEIEKERIEEELADIRMTPEEYIGKLKDMFYEDQDNGLYSYWDTFEDTFGSQVEDFIREYEEDTYYSDDEDDGNESDDAGDYYTEGNDKWFTS